MLLFKPVDVSDLQEFQVTVEERHWHPSTGPRLFPCAIQRALTEAYGIQGSVLVNTFVFIPDDVPLTPTCFEHDGSKIVNLFDNLKPFPGNMVVTFKRAVVPTSHGLADYATKDALPTQPLTEEMFVWSMTHFIGSKYR